MHYYAMIGNIGYLSVWAENDDEAREKIKNALCHRGGEDGIYARWCDHGRLVATFNPYPSKEVEGGHYKRIHPGNLGSDRNAFSKQPAQH